MSTERNVKTERSTGTGREKHEDHPVLFPDGGSGRAAALIGKITETVGYASFTDGGGAAGTYQMAPAIPAGAVVLGSKVLVSEGFDGDTTATLQIGDGSDVDRYMTGTPSVAATAATGIQTGVPSGSKLVTAANRPTLTITGGADWGNQDAGELTVEIFFIDA